MKIQLHKHGKRKLLGDLQLSKYKHSFKSLNILFWFFSFTVISGNKSLETFNLKERKYYLYAEKKARIRKILRMSNAQTKLV